MSKQIGLVTKTSSNGLTEVLTERRSACSGCQTTQGCNTCLTTAKIKAKVHNPIGAKPGDLVEIQMDNQAIWQGAMILYGFPLMGLIVGAIVGASVDVKWFASESTPSVLAGLAGLILGLALAVVLGNSRFVKQHLVPTITKVVSSAVPA